MNKIDYREKETINDSILLGKEKGRKERQKHGFEYEDIIIKKYNLIKDEKYTSENDAYLRWKFVINKEEKWCLIPVQIKFIKWKNSIDLGDFSRHTKRKSFILHIGFWKDCPDQIYHEETFWIDGSKWRKLFSCSFIPELLHEMSNISNSRDDDILWTLFRKKYTNLWGSRLIRLRFKRDHKKQKRLQCSLPFSSLQNTFSSLFSRISWNILSLFHHPVL